MQRHNITLKDNVVILDYSKSEYLHYFYAQRNLYKEIEDSRYVPKMRFFDNIIEVERKGTSLDLIDNISIREKEIIKSQIIEFIQFLYLKKIAHRDFWTRNVCWDGNQIWVIDWEYIIQHNPKSILNHYDITGSGEKSPEQTCKMNVFHKHKESLHKWLMPVRITKEEFII
jgi:hypothetical protein